MTNNKSSKTKVKKSPNTSSSCINRPPSSCFQEAVYDRLLNRHNINTYSYIMKFLG